MYDNTSKAVAFIINSDNEVYYEWGGLHYNLQDKLATDNKYVKW